MPTKIKRRSTAKPGFFLNYSVVKQLVDPLKEALKRGKQHRALDTFTQANKCWLFNEDNDCYLYTRWLLSEVHLLAGTYHKWLTDEETKTINEASRELIRLMQA